MTESGPPVTRRGHAVAALRDLITAIVLLDDPDDSSLDELADVLRSHAQRLRPAATSRYPTEGGRGVPAGTDSPKVMATNSMTGTDNPVAPPMEVSMVDGRAVGQAKFGPVYEGFPGLVHGGFLAAVLESLLPRPAASLGPRVTGTMTIRFRKPTPIGVTVGLEAHLVSLEERKAVTAAAILVGDEVHVEAEAVVVRLRGGDPSG